MMTTLAMIAGMLPIALALGEGGGFRAPMARAVIGGLITSTLLTLRGGAGGLHLLRRLRRVDQAPLRLTRASGGDGSGAQRVRGHAGADNGLIAAARAYGLRPTAMR